MEINNKEKRVIFFYLEKIPLYFTKSHFQNQNKYTQVWKESINAMVKMQQSNIIVVRTETGGWG